MNAIVTFDPERIQKTDVKLFRDRNDALVEYVRQAKEYWVEIEDEEPFGDMAEAAMIRDVERQLEATPYQLTWLDVEPE